MMNLAELIRVRLKGMPISLLLTVYAIIAFGLYNLYSATDASINHKLFYDQIAYIGIGSFVMLLIGVFLDFRNIERMTWVIYAIVCVMLIAVDVFGHNAKGAERWLILGPIRLQPSEFSKFAIILIVAKSVSGLRSRGFEFNLRELLKPIVLMLVPCVLILAQPDLGTAGLVFLIGALELLTLRIRLRSLLNVILLGVSGMLIAWSFVLYDYQKQRVITFLNPMRDPKGAGYHSIQSMIAVGNGGIWGQGFAQGAQTRLNFLPEHHTDFVFSVWAEERGFFGCVLLILLFSFLIVQLSRVVERTRDGFSAFVACGVAGFFMCHTAINMCMVTGLFPVVGVPLTFMSYGGTHMITAFACIGLVVAIERRRVALGAM